MAQIPSELISHSQQVCRLYKRAVRAVRDWYYEPHTFRLHAVLMRERFEKNKNVELRQAKVLLKKGEEELFALSHPIPYKFPTSVGGCAFEREAHVADWVLDFWHPIEKARYPKYFARREQMKDEYIKWYFKTYPEEKEKEKIDDH